MPTGATALVVGDAVVVVVGEVVGGGEIWSLEHPLIRSMTTAVAAVSRSAARSPL